MRAEAYDYSGCQVSFRERGREYMLLVAEAHFREDQEEEQYVTVTEEYFRPDL